jgi:predicted P-loop ATPase
MKKTALLLAIMTLGAIYLQAKEKAVMQGTIISENSVSCGSEEKGKKQTIQMMCQEYVIRTDTTEYHVRQEKEAHKGMLPVNASVELTLNKDKMKFKVNGKEYEMLVVSESAAPAGASSTHPASTSPANQDMPVQK